MSDTTSTETPQTSGPASTQDAPSSTTNSPKPGQLVKYQQTTSWGWEVTKYGIVTGTGEAEDTTGKLQPMVYVADLGDPAGRFVSDLVND